jgi:hypothetical protein
VTEQGSQGSGAVGNGGGVGDLGTAGSQRVQGVLEVTGAGEQEQNTREFRESEAILVCKELQEPDGAVTKGDTRNMVLQGMAGKETGNGSKIEVNIRFTLGRQQELIAHKSQVRLGVVKKPSSYTGAKEKQEVGNQRRYWFANCRT